MVYSLLKNKNENIKDTKKNNILSLLYLLLFFLPHPPLVLKPGKVLLAGSPLIHEFSLQSIHLTAQKCKIQKSVDNSIYI